jgi:PAS domain S-box-containing protein
MFGYSAAEAIGRHITLIIPPERNAEEDDVLAHIRRGEKVDHYETVRQTKDGRKVEISLTVSPIKDAEGHIIGASKVARDITGRKQAERDHALLAAIVDSSDDAIISETLEGVITSWNRGAENLFGYRVAEALDQHINLIIPPEHYAEEDDVLVHIRRSEKVPTYETVRQTKDGRRVEVSLTVSPIIDVRGRIIGASKVARDITAQKRAEEERERLVAREEAARRTAEEASRLKDDFLATVSHELRNPLNAIVGWEGLLRLGRLDSEKSAHAVDAIIRGAEAQDQIINDLLDISRIITGRLRLEVRPLNLHKVLESAIDTIRPAAEAKQISLRALLDPATSSMAGDPDRLRQIFWNLLSNAVKFTPREGRIQILSQRINSHIEITVNDNGIGIEPELLPYVFDRFRQGDSGINRTSRGLGLGLAIVRNLVELHGGTVRAKSNGPGQGASFVVIPFLPHSELMM